jgi:hypothetical protein
MLKGKWLPGLLYILMISSPVSAISADHKLITSVDAIYEYNDNIFFDDDDAVSDHIYTVIPELGWVRNAERLTTRVDGKIEWYRYQDNDELDDTDQWYNANLNYRPTERWQLGLEGHVSDDNRRDREIEETGLVLGTDRRRRFNTGASASYIFSETTSGGIYAAFNREDFDDPETSDRNDYSVVLFVNRDLEAWLARTTGRMNLRYSRYLFERAFMQESTGLFLGFFEVQITDTIADETDVDNISLTAGTETAFTEKIDLTWDLGARYSRSQRTLEQIRTYTPAVINEPPRKIDDSYENYGFVGSVSLFYRGERSSCNLLLSHDLAPVSGSSGTANRTTVRIGGSIRLLEKLSGNASLDWYWNLSDEDDPTQDDTDTQSWSARAGLRWEMNKHLDLAADYIYTFSDDHEAGTTAYRNKLLVRLVAGHDWLE